MSTNADRNTCERCRGTGFVVRDRAHDVTPTCPTCNGTGRTDPKAECCHGLDDVCAASGCLMGIPGGELA